MKSLKNYGVIFVIILLLSACVQWNNEYSWSLVEQDYMIFSGDDVVLSIKNGTKSSKGLTYEIQNKTTEKISYGTEVYLETKNDDRWYLMKSKTEMSWDALLIFLDPNTTEEYAIDWSAFYGQLPSGEYRLLKPIIIAEEHVYLAVEFRIE